MVIGTWCPGNIHIIKLLRHIVGTLEISSQFCTGIRYSSANIQKEEEIGRMFWGYLLIKCLFFQ